jgi:hypothetical protein
MEGAASYSAAQVERTIRRLQLSQLLRSSCWPLTNPAGTAIAVALTGGDHARVVAMLSLGSTLSSGLEFLVAPILGIAADRWGRKPLLLATALARFPWYLSNLIRPSLFAIFMEAFIDAAAFSVYTLAEQTILADMMTDAKALTVSTARLASPKGMAQMGSFLVGGTIAALNPRLPFALAATACLSSACVVAFGVTETAPSKRRVANTITDSNGGASAAVSDLPTGGVAAAAAAGVNDASESSVQNTRRAGSGPLSLLRGGRTLRLLTISALVDGMVDKTFQIRAIHATQRVGMGPATFGVFSAGRGLTSMCGGYATRALLRATGGVRGFNMATHACCVVQHVMMALAARGGTAGILLMFCALLPMTYGDMGVRQSGTMALHARAAAAAGIGLGEAQAALKTMQSALQLCLPVAYGRLYTLHPSSPWLVAGLLSACSQLVFVMLSAEDVAAIEQPKQEPEPEPEKQQQEEEPQDEKHQQPAERKDEDT